MRLIDADNLRREIQAQANPYGKPSIGYYDGVRVIQIIDRQITVDAEHVVRCKDCKYYYPNPMAGGVGECEWSTDALNDNGYCYRGERRE